MTVDRSSSRLATQRRGGARTPPGLGGASLVTPGLLRYLLVGRTLAAEAAQMRRSR